MTEADLTKGAPERRNFFGIPIEGGMWQERPERPQRPFKDLKPYFDKVWEKGFKAVAWQQYTPHWNDGETTEFGVREPSFTTSQEVADDWLNFEYEFDKYYYEVPYGNRKHPDGFYREDFPELPIDHYEFEYAMREKFGDHTEVVVTPTRVVQSEYEHD